MSRLLTIKNGVIFFVALISFLLIRTLFQSKQKDYKYELAKQELAFKDSALAMKEEIIKVKNQQNEQLNGSIAHHERTDSILLKTIFDFKLKYQANDKKLQDIVTTVNNLTKDELRRAITDY